MEGRGERGKEHSQIRMYSFSISALRHIIPAPLFTFHTTSRVAQTLNTVVAGCYSAGGVKDIATLKHRNSINCAKYSESGAQNKKRDGRSNAALLCEISNL